MASGLESKKQKAQGKGQKVGTFSFSVKTLPPFCLLLFAFCSLPFGASTAQAQLLKKGDYGVGVTIAIYQFDDTRSKKFGLVTKLKQTLSTPEDEIEYITTNYGVEEMKLRHMRPSVGLREGEPFTDTQPMNEKPFTYTITPRLITREDVSFDLKVQYGNQVLMEFTGLSANNYETLLLRGERGGFGVREFKGPEGKESVPETRALLMTITPAIIVAKGLQNRPSDISRPTDAYGSKVELSSSDTFELPTLINRQPVKFPPGAAPRGSITLECVVTPEGRVTNVRVLDTPDPAYNTKAIDAFRQYRFNPAKLNGRPTYATYRETIVLDKPKPL
jgi:TonB family protein